ncbi:MAG TPA: LON peptidase substrate-binding domain-containing protein [Actinomycetota bacterium]
MELPLFPLSSVLYPGLPIPLHIFEERYREMFGRVLAGERRFGVVAIARGREVGDLPEHHPVGCVAEVREVRRYPDGRLDVVAWGERRFRIEGIAEPAPYIVGDVALLPEPTGAGAERLAARVGWLFTRYLTTLLRFASEGSEQLEVPDDPVAASYLIAAGLQIELADKQRLLVAETAAERLRTEAGLLRRELALLEHLHIAGPATSAVAFTPN